MNGGGEAFARRRAVGLLADPDSPSELAEQLADELPNVLADRVDCADDWQVQVETAAQPIDDPGDLLDSADRGRRANRWDLAVYLTDAPLRANWYPVVAEVDTGRQIAGLSLPALGGVGLRWRAREALVRLLGQLAGDTSMDGIERGIARTGAGAKVARVTHPIRRTTHQAQGDERFVASMWRGRLRLLVGMVTTNHPARLLWGMSSALAAAVATSGFTLLTSTVWIISDQMPGWLLIFSGLAAVLAMTGWIIGYHRLWERVRGQRDREQALLYNSATVATIGLGVLTMYVFVFAANLLAELVLLSNGVFDTYLGHPTGASDFLHLAWLSTAVSTLAGAFGSGLEDEDSVRRAAYGYRERKRREREAEQRDREQFQET